MRTRYALVGALLVAATALAASPAAADIIITEAGGGTGNNVLFQCPDGDTTCTNDLNDDDLTLIGTIQNSTFQALFTADVNIQPGAAGQATIEEVDGTTTWTSLYIDWINFDSTDEVVLRVKPELPSATITIYAWDDQNTEFSQSFTGITGPSGAFFTLAGINSQTITQVRVVASAGSLHEVEQVRLGDLFEGDDVVLPEPSLMALFGVGLVASGYRARRRRGR